LKSRGQNCGDIEVAGYLANTVDPASLVLDLRIVHDRVGSSTDPTLNGHLRCPNNLDQSLNDTATDKIRKYRADYNNTATDKIRKYRADYNNQKIFGTDRSMISS
jgi:hypothetical protein